MFSLTKMLLMKGGKGLFNLAKVGMKGGKNLLKVGEINGDIIFDRNGMIVGRADGGFHTAKGAAGFFFLL